MDIRSEEARGGFTSAAGTFVMIGWIDPIGRWWVAPLGTSAPDLDEAMPEAWLPITFRHEKGPLT